jgi:dienelactone hydrolase
LTPLRPKQDRLQQHKDNVMKFLLFSLAVACMALPVSGAIQMKPVEYRDGATICHGWVAYDDAASGKRPGVLVVPEWWGVTDYPKTRAADLAKLGYVAFVADIYGDGKTTSDPKEAGTLAGQFYNDRKLMRQRASAALEQLKKQPNVDVTKLAAIGYCFGGTVVLEMARGGVPIKGVVSFHGGLETPSPAAAGQIKAKILVCGGGDDAFVPDKQVEAFKEEMRHARANWELIEYGGAHHAFTNPKADQFGIPNIKYNKQADERSWAAMKGFFDELFK